ncbi:peptidoglycan/xylan/chitin deacetylase (PgdA/CDA1 family) [Streptomyces aurantiacus]|uniref:polysaccharide deacetylase family protein n=1 Tax=Streptomyces aurantiacus TaxID=47760 RepID=UPI002792A2F6|nr:polysaccharide deacetylase [Streptomyces aurantiacus]MDQ0771708.1 peptidoglycan/xylan/chitin deacetylase (PgdA/CDA1 family) [Streptomyces aurantiacus]
MSSQQQVSTGQEPWQWDEATWRGYAERVRAGRDLTPPAWPGDARMAVTLSFDPDHETLSLRDGETSPGAMGRGEFGSRVGSRRILRLLDEFQIPATFFIPAVSALLHPQEAKDYAAAGHEIGAHGWIHERNALLSAEDEFALTRRSLDVLENLVGRRPVGIRTPSADFSDSTLDILQSLGFRYDSSLMADDMPYEILSDGRPTGIVEVPMEWIRDDAPYFTMARYGPHRPYMTPRAWAELMKDEFDSAYADGAVFQLVCHPHIIGHRARMLALRGLVEHMKAHQNVWYATHGEVADHVWRNAGQDEAGRVRL